MTLIMSGPFNDHIASWTVKIFLDHKTNQMNESGNFQDSDKDQAFDRNFKPRGAIAFFILLVLLGMVIWYGIYFLMLERI